LREASSNEDASLHDAGIVVFYYAGFVAFRGGYR